MEVKETLSLNIIYIIIVIIIIVSVMIINIIISVIIISVIITISIIIISAIIIITRPKPAFGRLGLGGSSGEGKIGKKVTHRHTDTSSL